MKALLTALIVATIATAGFEVGVGTGLQQRIGDGTRLPLVGQARFEDDVLGWLPVEVRGLAMTWQEDATADGRPLYVQGGGGIGIHAGDVDVFVGGGLSRYSGPIEEGDPVGWIAFRGNLTQAQILEFIVNYSSTGDEPLGVLAVCSWDL